MFFFTSYGPNDLAWGLNIETYGILDQEETMRIVFSPSLSFDTGMLSEPIYFPQVYLLHISEKKKNM
jgi:hypothetical protein